MIGDPRPVASNGYERRLARRTGSDTIEAADGSGVSLVAGSASIDDMPCVKAGHALLT